MECERRDDRAFPRPNVDRPARPSTDAAPDTSTRQGPIVRHHRRFVAETGRRIGPLVSTEMSARLDALILCDFAQIRDGLLFVQSGGLTRLVANSLPAAFGCHVAAMVHMPPHEAVEAHHMVMKVKSADTATLVATIQVALHEVPRPAGLLPGEGRQVPVVVPLHKVIFPQAGRYDLQVDIDDEIAADLTFTVSEA